MRGTRHDIVSRRTVVVTGTGGKQRPAVMRFLECGHQQFEPSGGKAHLALQAICKRCREEKARPPPTQYAEGFTDGFLAGKVP